MDVFCGIGWATGHHDVAIIDAAGVLLAKARIGDDAAGLAGLLALLAEHGDDAEDPIPIAIETSRGLLVAALRATGRPVYAINPAAAARYRERTAISRKKSDHIDAMALAGILRTDRAKHRPLPADTELAQQIAVLARAQQDASDRDAIMSGNVGIGSSTGELRDSVVRIHESLTSAGWSYHRWRAISGLASYRNERARSCSVGG